MSAFLEGALARFETKEIPLRPYFPEPVEEFERFFRKSRAEVWQIHLPLG